MMRPACASSTTSGSATRRFAAVRWPVSRNSSTPMLELETQVARFLNELKRNNVSAHTAKAYGSDLRQFADYFAAARPAEFDVIHVRRWLGGFYTQKISPGSLRRKLAAHSGCFCLL